MRALACLVLMGCSYAPPRGTGAGGDGGPDDPDAPVTPPPNTAHVRRIEIVDAQVTGGPHVDYPLLISLSESWLRTAPAGDVEHPEGFDIVFTADRAGASRLAHEIESYQGASGTLVAWVKVPSLAATTELFVHYGDPAVTASQQNIAPVWSTYAAVWHLGADLRESKSDAVAASDGSTGESALIGDGRTFDGADDDINLASDAAIGDVFGGGGTVELWFRASSFGEQSRGRLFNKGDLAYNGTFANGWMLQVDNSNISSSLLFGRQMSTTDGFWTAPPGSIQLNQWTHVAIVYDDSSSANAPAIFVDGTSVAVSVFTAPAGNAVTEAAFPLMIANRGVHDRAFGGNIDEVRVSHGARDPDWIATSVRNQRAPGNFLTVGPEL